MGLFKIFIYNFHVTLKLDTLVKLTCRNNCICRYFVSFLYVVLYVVSIISPNKF